MKRKYIALLLGLTLTFTSIPVYASEGNASSGTIQQFSNDSNPGMNMMQAPDMENMVMGTVISIQEDSITISTSIQMTKPDGEEAATETPSDEEAATEAPSGEEQTITVTEDTVITKSSRGMGGGMNKGGGMDGMGGQHPDGEVSEKPDGEADSTEAANGNNSENEVPEKPDGKADFQDGMGMEGETISLSDIQVGDMVFITLAEDGSAASITLTSMDEMATPGKMNAFESMGPSAAPEEYNSATTYTEDTESDGETFSSTGTDENALLVDSDISVSIQNAEVDRTSSDSTGGDNSSFYGIGAAVLSADGNISISDSTITTDAAGGAGVFAYGDGTAYVADSTITTQQDTSGGIHVAGGGTLYAWDLTVETNGESSAAIRSDRGSGTMVVDGGSYTSNGIGSPAVYSTADIAIHNADLTASGSEAICIEGLNSIHLYDCDLSGNMSDDERNDCTWTVILYQSMSGDSEVGNSTFQMNGGTLTSGNGGLFYTTNTECTMTLQDVDITYSEDSDFFLRCTGNANERGWGQTGSNGSDCLFTAIQQEMSGDIIWDSISSLDFYITDTSTLTGAFLDDETYAGESAVGCCNVYLDSTSTWTVTGDSRITALYAEGTIQDADGNSVSIVGTDGTTYVEGTSEYTITVDTYSDTVDTSGATTPVEWTNYAVERPENL